MKQIEKMWLNFTQNEKKNYLWKLKHWSSITAEEKFHEIFEIFQDTFFEIFHELFNFYYKVT